MRGDSFFYLKKLIQESGLHSLPPDEVLAIRVNAVELVFCLLNLEALNLADLIKMMSLYY